MNALTFRGKVTMLFKLSDGGLIVSEGEYYQFEQPQNGRQYEVGDEVTFQINAGKRKVGYWFVTNITLLQNE